MHKLYMVKNKFQTTDIIKFSKLNSIIKGYARKWENISSLMWRLKSVTSNNAAEITL